MVGKTRKHILPLFDNFNRSSWKSRKRLKFVRLTQPVVSFVFRCHFDRNRKKYSVFLGETGFDQIHFVMKLRLPLWRPFEKVENMLVLASEQIFDCRELVLETLVNFCVVNNGGYLTGVQYFVQRHDGERLFWPRFFRLFQRPGVVAERWNVCRGTPRCRRSTCLGWTSPTACAPFVQTGASHGLDYSTALPVPAS